MRAFSRRGAMALVVALALLDSSGHVLAAPDSAATPTLRACASAVGGSWTEPQIQRFASIFDLVVVGASGTRERVSAFHSARPGIRVLAYLDGFDFYSDSRFGQWVENHHPDWILRGSSGQPIHTYRNPQRWALDRGLPALRAFFADSAKRRLAELGADGLLVDNCFPGWDYANLARGQGPIARYSDAAAWRESVEGFLAALEQAIAPAPLAANQVTPWTEHAQLVALEQFPIGGASWAELRERLERVARSPGRTPMLLIGLGSPTDPARAFITASVLLAVEPGAYLGFSWPGGRDSVRAVPEYRLALGRPLGAAREERGVWWRDFERARVLVNPGDESRATPWPGWVASAEHRSLPAHSAGLAWRPGLSERVPPDWVAPGTPH